MAPRHPDPFDDLRLDERFVRDARFLEPSASERAGNAPRARGGRCKVVPAPRGLQGFVHRLFVAPPRPKPRARRLTRILAVLTLAVGLISLTFVALRQTASRGAPVATEPIPASQVSTPATGPAVNGGGLTVGSATGPGVSADPARITVDPAIGARDGFALPHGLFASLRRGDCLSWSVTSSGPVAPARVPCSSPHVDEVTRIVDLTGRFDRWPGIEVLRTTARQTCAGSLRAYVGGLDVAPHHVIGSVRPDRQSWEWGARGLACTIRSDDLAARSGPFTVAGSAPS